MLWLKKNCFEMDDLARNMDRISLEIDSLKIRSIPPKHDINESLKCMRISIDECKERTAKMHAKRDRFVKACSSSFCENNDEDLKVICGKVHEQQKERYKVKFISTRRS